MISMLILLLALAAPQLAPELTPHKAPKPALPKIDENACPFEGCQFGAWTAREKVQLYSTWKDDRQPLGEVQKGEEVTAVTGIHITLQPFEIQVTAPMPDYDLKPGDTVFGYMNYGEGVFSAWFNGYWVENFDGSTVVGPADSGCRRNCTAKWIRDGRVEWWVKIKTKNGTVGWTKETAKFDGQDALAGSLYEDPRHRISSRHAD
jgi:hypothetical protein